MMKNMNSKDKTNFDFNHENINAAPICDNLSNSDGVRNMDHPSVFPRCAPGMNGWGAMFICPKCGQRLAKTGLNCDFCGAKVFSK